MEIHFGTQKKEGDCSPFYPTYEEWKYVSDVAKFSDEEPFYPTYEEWKFEYTIMDKDCKVTFLSYL